MAGLSRQTLGHVLVERAQDRATQSGFGMAFSTEVAGARPQALVWEPGNFVR